LNHSAILNDAVMLMLMNLASSTYHICHCHICIIFFYIFLITLHYSATLWYCHCSEH